MKRHETSVSLLLVLATLGSMVLPSLASAENVESKSISREPGPDAEGQRHEDRILWMDSDHLRAIFLPESVTATVSIGDLPLTPFERRVLERTVVAFKNPKRGYSCMQKSPPTPGSGDVKSLDELIAMTETSFIGSVIRRVEGWSPWTSEVVTATYLAVEEVVHGGEVDATPTKGAVVAIYYRGGQTTVDGTPICFEPYKGFPVPLEGDKLLVAGRPWSADSNYFYDIVRIPVVEGEARPEPRADLRAGEQPRPLGELVFEIRKEARERGRQ